MNNRTYRYFKGTPLYRFGYGLSYTTFKYQHLTIPSVIKRGKAMKLSVTVKNTGQVAGDEVVQIYVTHNHTHIKVPLKALKGFTRIFLKAGEQRILNFTLLPDDLAVTNVNGELVLLKGKITISAGGCQPGELNITSGNSVSNTITLL
ncbi:hypothetical protein RG47T_1824 [Mucilaginibacter polytrichastri]|uniref:Fibronectin type III-like domain-containing protein n=4 Tax=Mucilaginibacter polytrichastri TaxID=1302689 RepID=A0A1Q5ZXB2_9SPHI|nr:hypothetical protein RG47T_1824 [Mucilaginibacter polytrichastri]